MDGKTLIGEVVSRLTGLNVQVRVVWWGKRITTGNPP